jgi:hypothetical protein
VILAERLAGGPDRVQRVAVGAAATGWPLGSGDLDDWFAVLWQELCKAGAEAARALDRPAATARQIEQGEVQQLLVAGGIGAGRGLSEHPAKVGDGGGGQGARGGCRRRRAPSTSAASMGIAVVLLVWATAVVGGGRGRRRPCRSHRAARL